MREIRITLPDPLYEELQAASAAIREHGYGVEAWAEDAVCSALATRRLPSVTLGAHGPRISTPEVEEAEEVELEGYPVHCPDRSYYHGNAD